MATLQRNARTWETKTAYAAATLRQAFADGKYMPGDRLFVTKLAEDFGLSLTPVREALFELASEGLVDLMPHRGARVADVPVSTLAEVYLLRELLESVCTRFAAERATEDEVNELAECHERFVEAAEDARRDDLRQLSDEFHTRIYDAARSPLLRRLIRIVWVAAPEDTFRVIRDRPQRSINYHQKILDALRRSDPSVAETLMRDHIRDSLELIRDAKSDLVLETEGRGRRSRQPNASASAGKRSARSRR